jgi:hypothetical protein
MSEKETKMKNLMIIGILILFSSSSAYAGCEEKDVSWESGGQWHTHEYCDTDTDKDTNDRLQNAAGVGADVILWQSPSEHYEVVAEYKYDERNGRHSVYGVVRMNLWQRIRAWFGRDTEQKRTWGSLGSAKVSE